MCKWTTMLEVSALDAIQTPPAPALLMDSVQLSVRNWARGHRLNKHSTLLNFECSENLSFYFVHPLSFFRTSDSQVKPKLQQINE